MNNIRFPIQERVNPAVYSVVWNLKIIGVAGLLACVLGRPISRRQWGGVMLLITGSTLAEASQWERKDDLKAAEQLAAEVAGAANLSVENYHFSVVFSTISAFSTEDY